MPELLHYRCVREIVKSVSFYRSHLARLHQKSVKIASPNVFHTCFCCLFVGAVKFGEPLGVSECQELIKRLSKCQLPFQCAHGRCLFTFLFFVLRGSVKGFLTSFVKNGEIRPSLSYKIILEQLERNQLNS